MGPVVSNILLQMTDVRTGEAVGAPGPTDGVGPINATTPAPFRTLKVLQHIADSTDDIEGITLIVRLVELIGPTEALAMALDMAFCLGAKSVSLSEHALARIRALIAEKERRRKVAADTTGTAVAKDAHERWRSIAVGVWEIRRAALGARRSQATRQRAPEGPYHESIV